MGNVNIWKPSGTIAFSMGRNATFEEVVSHRVINFLPRRCRRWRHRHRKWTSRWTSFYRFYGYFPTSWRPSDNVTTIVLTPRLLVKLVVKTLSSLIHLPMPNRSPSLFLRVFQIPRAKVLATSRVYLPQSMGWGESSHHEEALRWRWETPVTSRTSLVVIDEGIQQAQRIFTTGSRYSHSDHWWYHGEKDGSSGPLLWKSQLKTPSDGRRNLWTNCLYLRLWGCWTPTFSTSPMKQVPMHSLGLSFNRYAIQSTQHSSKCGWNLHQWQTNGAIVGNNHSEG